MRASRGAAGFALCLLLCLHVTPTTASFEEDYAKYQLFVDCEPISVGIVFNSAHATRAGVTEAKIRNYVEGRLRRVGVPLEVSSGVLTAAVHLSVEDRPVIEGKREVTRIGLAFWKTMREPFGQQIGYSATWEYVTLIEPGLDDFSFYVTIMTGLDKFLDKYGRVNTDPCTKR